MAGPDFTPDVHYEPWWWETAPRTDQKETALPQTCDVLIVGAGFTGVSAALSLARGGRNVCVLEAAALGHGASTRNGGMIGSGHKVPFEALAAQYGEAVAVGVMREGLHALDYATDLIEREAIACDFVRSGRFRGAWRAVDYEAIAREMEFMRKHVDLDADMVPRNEQHREIAHDHYHGGCVYHAHGGLQPARFFDGIAARARDAGAQLIDHAPVQTITREPSGYCVQTPRGVIRAKDVVVASNGYTTGACDALRRRLIPIASHMIATEPLGAERVRALIPGGRMIVETRSRHCYYRASPDGERILLGARAALNHMPPHKSGLVLRRLLVGLFPELDDMAVSHSWLGTLGFTEDHLPRIGQDTDGVYYALGYSGSGVAMAPYLGWRVANKVLGTKDGQTGFDPLDFPAVRFHGFIPLALPFMNLWYRWKDIREGA